MTKAAFYDDPSFDYRQYWRGRKYEHLSELAAIKRLIEQIPYSRRNNLLEVGAGFGRLAESYNRLFKKCVLLEPSRKLLSEARRLFKKEKNLVFQRGVGEKIPFKDQSFDLVLIVRVFHHLYQPEKTIREINRVLKLNGFLILEFANKIHFKKRLIALMRRESLSLKPIDIRSPGKVKDKAIPFINYHPIWVEEMLNQHNFKIVEKLSVSNLRFSLFKKTLPLSVILCLERRLQLVLARFNFAPSIFILAQKKSDLTKL